MMEQANGRKDDDDFEDDWLSVSVGLESGPADEILSERRARLWALVLDARYVPCRIDHAAGGCRLLTPAASHVRAVEELRLFEDENSNWPPPAPAARPLAENTLATLSVLFLLATFHNITQLSGSVPGHAATDWFELGSARVNLVLAGEWWRLVTALTLHADWLHLVSNLTIGGLFVFFLCRELGSGLAWSLLLAAGTLGNWTNAHVQLPTHSSVGASTTVFGAVGILAALSLVRYRHQLRRRWPLPVAAALALLALLGSEGKNTDLGAHLFGFLSGIALGLVTEFLVGRYGRPDRGLNALLALAAAAVVVASWWAALLYGIY